MMKTWFITGANRGIGLGIARSALEAGDQVVATARNAASIQSALSDNPDRLLAVTLDVTKAETIEAAVEEAKNRFGRIDVLVNNAGYGQLGAFEQLSEAAIERQFATNVFGVFAVTRAVLPVMRTQRSGHVLTISSIAGLVGFPGSSIYCSSKFAVEGWSEALSAELEPFGIKATLIEPGRFRTDFLDSSSVSHTDVSIPDYTETAERRKAELDDGNHKQPGDPVKLAQAMLKVVASQHPPVRFAAGSDANEVVLSRLAALREEADAWRPLTLSTDITD
ncbi:SDR family NAD(P)-dependent oxidoreductase [Agrobacterium tumefaciens]|nr:SDR family NAD(P)-dependent oxidoreductase [Agrobacterium tumefaciens]